MKTLLLCFTVLIAAVAQGQKQPDFKFLSGDLLFQDLDCGGLCDAIETVTKGIDGKHFSHIGLVYVKQDSVLVIEAIGKDVHLTPIDRFMSRQLDAQGNPKICVARLRPAYQSLNQRALAFALGQLQTPYDDEFIYKNGKYYCSELIYDAYKDANGGKAFFKLQPMTFKDPATKKTFPAWTAYYQELNAPVPEGKPGCNPGGISMSPKIVLVKAFY